MGFYATLREHLAEWAGDDTQRRAIAETIKTSPRPASRSRTSSRSGRSQATWRQSAATTPMGTPRKSWISSATRL